MPVSRPPPFPYILNLDFGFWIATTFTNSIQKEYFSDCVKDGTKIYQATTLLLSLVLFYFVVDSEDVDKASSTLKSEINSS